MTGTTTINIGKCAECGSIIDKNCAKKVERWFYGERNQEYFCNVHAPAYDEVHFRIIGDDQYIANRVRVSEDGTPIGYIRAPVQEEAIGKTSNAAIKAKKRTRLAHCPTCGAGFRGLHGVNAHRARKHYIKAV